MTGVAIHNNLEVFNPAVEFFNVKKFDLRLKLESAALNSGNAEFAPQVDIRGRIRPQGSSVDIGAYEGQ